MTSHNAIYFLVFSFGSLAFWIWAIARAGQSDDMDQSDRERMDNEGPNHCDNHKE